MDLSQLAYTLFAFFGLFFGIFICLSSRAILLSRLNNFFSFLIGITVGAVVGYLFTNGIDGYFWSFQTFFIAGLVATNQIIYAILPMIVTYMFNKEVSKLPKREKDVSEAV